MIDVIEKLNQLNLSLPPVPPPLGVYKPVLVADKMLYVSGQGPMQNDGTLIVGQVGSDMSLEQGYMAARQVGLTMLATIKSQIHDLSRIKRIIKTLGMVNSAPNFYDHPKVINGFSELMAEIWGRENGIGARSAVGMILPGNIPVEIEAIFELH